MFDEEQFQAALSRPRLKGYVPPLPGIQSGPNRFRFYQEHELQAMTNNGLSSRAQTRALQHRV